MAFLFDFYDLLISISSMNLLQKFISVFLIQIFGFFLINPLFANSESNFIITTSGNISDSCGKNIQCYEVDEDQYSCTQSEAGINSTQSHTSNIQVWKTDILTRVFLEFSKQDILLYREYLISLYQDPEWDKYPFVGIIKIQV